MSPKPKKFTFHDRQLQIKAMFDSDAWKVRVYEGDTPATGVVYSVSHETAVDAKMQSVPLDLVYQLMGLAQADVEKGVVRLV